MATATKLDALELLKKDHEKVAKILEQLEDTTKRAAKTRHELLDELKKELSLHEHIEETLFYPSVKDNTSNKEVKELVSEAYEEHHLVNTIIDELYATPTEDDAWKAKLTVLRENIEHHVHEEEHDLFPKAKQTLGTQALEKMGEKIELMKQEGSM